MYVCIFLFVCVLIYISIYNNNNNIIINIYILKYSYPLARIVPLVTQYHECHLFSGGIPSIITAAHRRIIRTISHSRRVTVSPSHSHAFAPYHRIEVKLDPSINVTRSCVTRQPRASHFEAVPRYVA